MTKQSQKNKNRILEYLRENPNLQRACKKAGFARSTIYRWMYDDIDFRDGIRDAQEIGQDTINDYVEAKLMENIQTNNQRSIEFYLRHNDPRYATNQTEAKYHNQRMSARTQSIPYGIDQMYYNTELKMYDKSVELTKIQETFDDIRAQSIDPNTPISAEQLGQEFAREFYKLYPEAKTMHETQMKQFLDFKKSAD
jgi:hypothetical protein